MNSLNRFRPAKQFRCPPLVGRNVPFGYVERVRCADGSHNYQPADNLVGAFSAMNEKGPKEWKSLIANTETTGELKSTSSDMNAKSAKLFSGERVTHMTACSLLSGLGISLKGLKHEH